MARYCITAAKPKNASHHLNSEFKLWKYTKDENGDWYWSKIGWRRTAHVVNLLDEGNEVLTANESGTSITQGAAVEVELRIAKNESDYKISAMPDT